MSRAFLPQDMKITAVDQRTALAIGSAQELRVLEWLCWFAGFQHKQFSARLPRLRLKLGLAQKGSGSCGSSACLLAGGGAFQRDGLAEVSMA